MSGAQCCICEQSFGNSSTVEVERGLDKLINASVERGDRKHEQLQKLTSIKVHVQCRKEYTRPSSINAYKKKRENEEEVAAATSPLKKKMRSSQFAFDFKNCCFICGKDADEKKENKKRKELRLKISHVCTLGFEKNIINVAKARGDEWAKAVQKRVILNTDLVAAEAKYHQHCLNKFNLPVSRQKKSGRPADENVAEAMDKIFSFIENNEDSQFTLNELKEVVSDYLPDNKTIKKKLEDKYGDRIIITTKKTGFTIISFRETHINILNQAWYEKKKLIPMMNAAGFLIHLQIFYVKIYILKSMKQIFIHPAQAYSMIWMKIFLKR